MRLLLLLLGALAVQAVKECKIRPYEAKGPSRQGDNGYSIEIEAANEKSDNGSTGFVPGETYKVVIRSYRTKFIVRTFRGFVLGALFEENEKAAGKFEVIHGKGDARTAPGCRRAGVSHSHLRPKTFVETIWKAPDVSAGCVIFRASVIESKYVWFSEAGQLTRRFCVKGNIFIKFFLLKVSLILATDT
ncbi:unnamed protein product [Nippostrongylus brasiliensis]|uniref:Reelin domain-containing protein n=1 Tax=Nippostrongylus brasiliensis TaxID=27835 RepID=A0A0N4YQ04_NIPBR|nr:unnamed protein product [Nippostrongylus brasiliensis]